MIRHALTSAASAALLAATLAACAAAPFAATSSTAAAAAPNQGHGAHGAAVIATPAPPATFEARVISRTGREIGRASLSEGPAGVMISLEFLADALPPGWHGAHLHQVGRCDDFAAGFQASGPHLGKADGVAHGLLHPQGPEAGDLPSLFAPAGTKFGVEFFSSFVTLGPSNTGRTPLFDADGAALVIHEARDDQLTQPIGGAGARIACVALTR